MTIALILLILGVAFVVCCAERFMEEDPTDDELVTYWTTFEDNA